MKKIIVIGPALSQTGYGEQTRFALRSLLSRPDLFDVYLQPTNWGSSGWLLPGDKDKEWIDQIVRKTFQYNGFCQKNNLPPSYDASLQVSIPNEWKKITPENYGYTAGIETTKVSPEWIEKSALMDKIITISNHSKNTFESTAYNAVNQQTGEKARVTCTTPIGVAHYPVRHYEPAPIDLRLHYDFNFLCVAQWGPRKNIENTIRWWIEEFKDEEVGLVVKTNLAKNSVIDRHHTTKRLQSVISDFPDRKCKIYLVHGYMTPEEMTSVYQHPKIKCLVSLTHGEGFGLPIFEAAYNGLPVIAPNWSGHVDFLYAPRKVKKNKKTVTKVSRCFAPVEYDMKPIHPQAVWPGVLQADSLWCDAKEDSYKKQLRKVYSNYNYYRNITSVLKKHLIDNFTEETQYKEFLSCIYDDINDDEVDISQIPKISLVTSVYDASEHIEQLMENITSQTIFEEKCEWILMNVNPEGEDFEEEVILKYKKKYPKNIIYKRYKRDPGVYGIWNRGIKLSSGEYVTNVNCDDRRRKDGLEKQAKMLVLNSDVSLVYNDSFVVHEPNVTCDNLPSDAKRYKFEEYSQEAMLRGNLPHNNPMWRKNLHEKHGYFNQKYRSAGDWDFWLRCSLNGEVFKKHPEVLGVYYFNEKGISTNPEHDDWKKEEEREVFKKHLTGFKEAMKQA
jgi:glycosyltransferase involved in cell wall biosynthesis